MIKRFEQLFIAKELVYWFLLLVPVAVVTGTLVAFFLWLLDLVTVARWNHMWLIFLLPVAGIFITWLYKRFGKNSDGGNNLIIDEIHEPGGGIPVRMAPLVLFSTLVTHLFGGSAGREGTAVQIGGGISALFLKWYRLKEADKHILLMCGISAGFGAVFGTPVAGAVFAVEVLNVGRIKYYGLMPCLIAGMLADYTCSLWGIHHTLYSIAATSIDAKAPTFFSTGISVLLSIKVIAASVAFGFAGWLFSFAAHGIKKMTLKYFKRHWTIPVAGGLLVIAISYLLGTFDYLGLGVVNPNGGVSILSSFNYGGAQTWSWLWKLLLTAITVSTGFKGGEVTPLFFIGATLGNTIAVATGVPVDLFAALGFIAVFAAATNTPLACTLMGVELFGAQHVAYYAIACFIAYYFSGNRSIYSAQRTEIPKHNR